MLDAFPLCFLFLLTLIRFSVHFLFLPHSLSSFFFFLVLCQFSHPHYAVRCFPFLFLFVTFFVAFIFSCRSLLFHPHLLPLLRFSSVFIMFFFDPFICYVSSLFSSIPIFIFSGVRQSSHPYIRRFFFVFFLFTFYDPFICYAHSLFSSILLLIFVFPVLRQSSHLLYYVRHFPFVSSFYFFLTILSVMCHLFSSILLFIFFSVSRHSSHSYVRRFSFPVPPFLLSLTHLSVMFFCFFPSFSLFSFPFHVTLLILIMMSDAFHSCFFFLLSLIRSSSSSSSSSSFASIFSTSLCRQTLFGGLVFWILSGYLHGVTLLH